MNDKQQLAAMGDELRLTEDQAKGLAERLPKTGVLQILDDEPLCMAKRIEELEAQVRGLKSANLSWQAEMEELDSKFAVALELLRESTEWMEDHPAMPDSSRIRAALSGNLPERHPDDAAVDRFAIAMKAKLAAARDKGRGGWDDPNACSVEFPADLLVGHIGKGNPGNFEDIANLAMMLHQRCADPAVLSGKVPVVPEGWQLVPTEPTPDMATNAMLKAAIKYRCPDAYERVYRAMLAAAPKPEAK